MKYRRLFTLFLIVSVFFFSDQAHAEIPSELVVGVPQFDPHGNIVRDNDLVFQLLRNSVSDPIVRIKSSEKRSGVSLVLADSFQVNEDLTVWSYRIREGALFSNGQPLRGIDVCDSVIQCGKGNAKKEFTLTTCSVRAHQLEASSREWIDLAFGITLDASERQQAVTEFLQQCPIFEKRSRELFSGDYGDGVNILGVGEYRLSGIQPGKEYRMERYQWNTLGRAAPQQLVTLRGFKSMRDALSALRAGTISMFFNTDPEIVSVVSGDETLRISHCVGNEIVYRRGIEFECQHGVRLSSVIWTLPAEK